MRFNVVQLRRVLFQPEINWRRNWMIRSGKIDDLTSIWAPISLQRMLTDAYECLRILLLRMPL